MKIMMTAVAVVCFFMGSAAVGSAASLEKGKLLFESKTFAGATSGKSCKSCHDEGQGLSARILTMEYGALAEMVNACIENPLAGKAIDSNGERMADIIAYMKSLVKKGGGSMGY